MKIKRITDWSVGTVEYQVGKYEFKTTQKDNAVFWANDEFWNDWPELTRLGIVYADHSKASPSNFGHVDIRVNKLYRKICAKCDGLYLDIKWESTAQSSGILDCWECKAQNTKNS